MHPSATPLALPRVGVHVEQPELGAARVVKAKGAHGLVPDAQARRRDDAHAEEVLCHAECAVEHTLEREVGAQRFVVERVALALELLRVVADVPGRKLRRARALELAAIRE